MSMWEMKARWHYCWGRVCERVGDEGRWHYCWGRVCEHVGDEGKVALLLGEGV